MQLPDSLCFRLAAPGLLALSALFLGGVSTHAQTASPPLVSFDFAHLTALGSGSCGGAVTATGGAAGILTSPSLSRLSSDGSFVVAWKDFAAAFARRFDANGSPMGAKFQVSPGSHFVSGTSSSVSAAAFGSFVVGWTDASSSAAFVQRYDASGAPVGGAIQASAGSHLVGTSPSVSTASDGSFVVGWTNGINNAAFVQRYDASGAPVGSEIQASSAGHSVLTGPSVSTTDCSFVVAWTDSNSSLAFAQGFDVAGAVLGSAIQASPGSHVVLTSPSASMAPDDSFAMAWTNEVNGATHAQRFDPVSATPLITLRKASLASQSVSGTSPSVSTASDGSFAVAWVSGSFASGLSAGIPGTAFHKQFRPIGPALSGVIQASPSLNFVSGGTSPSVSMPSCGSAPIVAWTGFSEKASTARTRTASGRQVSFDFAQLTSLGSGSGGGNTFFVQCESEASVCLRNAGTNPMSYFADPPVIGSSWTATVDNVLAGQATSILLAFDSAVNVPLGGGQTILGLDLLGSGELFTGSGLSPSILGPTDFFSSFIPNNSGLNGRVFHSQALQFGVPPFVLSNAQDLAFGVAATR